MTDPMDSAVRRPAAGEAANQAAGGVPAAPGMNVPEDLAGAAGAPGPAQAGKSGHVTGAHRGVAGKGSPDAAKAAGAPLVVSGGGLVPAVPARKRPGAGTRPRSRRAAIRTPLVRHPPAEEIQWTRDPDLDDLPPPWPAAASGARPAGTRPPAHVGRRPTAPAGTRPPVPTDPPPDPVPTDPPPTPTPGEPPPVPVPTDPPPGHAGVPGSPDPFELRPGPDPAWD